MKKQIDIRGIGEQLQNDIDATGWKPPIRADVPPRDPETGWRPKLTPENRERVRMDLIKNTNLHLGDEEHSDPIGIGATLNVRTNRGNYDSTPPHR